MLAWLRQQEDNIWLSGNKECYPHSRAGTRVEGQTLYVNRLDQPEGARRRLRIPARDVSICLQAPADSSILNILPVTIEEIGDCEGARLLLRLALGDQHLLARITRKSSERLGLAAGDKVFAQIKSVALLSEDCST